MRKATSMREWALVDAGGGAVVDLVPDGAGGHVEALSARKVNALRRRALVIYIRVRPAGGGDACALGSLCGDMRPAAAPPRAALTRRRGRAADAA